MFLRNNAERQKEKPLWLAHNWVGCSGSETTDGLIQEARWRCTNKDNEPTNTDAYCTHFQHTLFKWQLFSIITLVTINTLISQTKGPVETQVIKTRKMRVSHDYHDSLIKPAPCSMGDMNEHKHTKSSGSAWMRPLCAGCMFLVKKHK